MYKRQVIPCVELNELVNNQLLSKYEYLMLNQLWVPCANIITSIPSIIKQSWLSRLTAERLEQKSKMVLDALDQNNRDWESVCYQKLARALGGQVNGEIMEILARLTPLSIIYKHRDQLLQLEALLFGQSGLLMEADAADEYITKLQNEYVFLKSKYTLHSLKSVSYTHLDVYKRQVQPFVIAFFSAGNASSHSIAFSLYKSLAVEIP